MIGYAEEVVFTAADLALLELATALVAKAPGKVDGEWVRCHEIARAVGRLLQLQWVDGKYDACAHSWLLVRRRVILDVYVPARLPQVQLVDTSCPWANANYHPDPNHRTDIDRALVEKLHAIIRPRSPLSHLSQEKEALP